MPESPLNKPVLDWYAANQRDLPWRRPDAGAWAVLVSEVMLQQTGVARVLPVYEAWLARWPTPGALAADTAGEAIRMWGRLGYPRRAQRLWLAAQQIETLHGGVVPPDLDELLRLPGIGDYTAAAVAAFAYRQRHVVLDTNVRRVLGRVRGGEALQPTHLTNAERDRANSLLPDDPDTAATWSVATMELGALICTVATPNCDRCPVLRLCRWRRLGYPPYVGPVRRGQRYVGTDRQCRGAVLAVLRDTDGDVPRDLVRRTWPEPTQLERAVASLIDDGLVVERGDESLALP
jgi:A/G-specific adenine glycosylase